MPQNHRKYTQFNKEFILDWGLTVGPSTLLTIERIIESYPTEKQGLKSTYGLMKLADKYSIEVSRGHAKEYCLIHQDQSSKVYRLS